jgi:hypothetical protein
MYLASDRVSNVTLDTVRLKARNIIMAILVVF